MLMWNCFFSVDDEEKRQSLKEMEVELPEDGTLIIPRKSCLPEVSAKSMMKPLQPVKLKGDYQFVD